MSKTRSSARRTSSKKTLAPKPVTKVSAKAARAEASNVDGTPTVSYTRRARENWPKELRDDLTIYAPQKVYNSRKLEAGEHVQLGVTFKKREDIDLWEGAVAAFPGLHKIEIIRLALTELLASKSIPRPRAKAPAKSTAKRG